MRVKHGPYLKANFRVHAFLAGVPLYDVWPVMLHARGQGHSIRDVARVFAAVLNQPVDPLILILFRWRARMGVRLGWDAPDRDAAQSLYRDRVDDSERVGLDLHGVPSALGFREVYTAENETLLEIKANVAHAFIALAMEPVAEGYVLHIAVYVKKTNWFTPLYMTLIDPFRRFIVYPILMHDLEQAWADVYARQQQPGAHRRR